MKILILGASGMAGHVIALYLKKCGYNVVAFSRTKLNYCETIIGNVLDFEKLKKVIYNNGFDVVINAVGVLNQEADNNKGNAVLLNSYLPHYLAEVTIGSKTKVIHMSTDCVFSGSSGKYIESSLRDGDTFYDRSKALGELVNSKDLTFRNSIIGPDRKKEGIGLFNWFMKQKEELNGYTKAIWTGVSTITLAKAMERAIKVELTGLYHLVNNESINKYELLKLFNKHFRNNELEINKNNNVIVDKSLINTRTDFDFKVPSYEDMVKEMKEWIQDYPELYPHYLD